MSTTRVGPPAPTGAVRSALGTPDPDPLLPAYGRSTLADLLPAVAARLGVAGFADPLGLPATDRYVVVLVDGLGWDLVGAHADDAPYLASLLGRDPLTSGVPSTTATSLTSLGTGLPPGTHGIVGYSFWLPQQHAVLNPLTWDVDIAPTICQPWPTVFDSCAAAGVAVGSVSLQRFAGSGLTQAALRGATFHGFVSEADEATRIELVVRAAAQGGRSLVYAYERELDHTGHAEGVASPRWLRHLRRIDHLCRRLRSALPDDTAMIITGDHGMINVPATHRLVVEDIPELLDGVAVFAGESRLRQLYLEPGVDPAAVIATWQRYFGAHAWIVGRDDAIGAGWFGEVHPLVAGRIGDVLVAARGDWAVMTRTLPRELALVGMHGSLTPAEMQVPLLVDG